MSDIYDAKISLDHSVADGRTVQNATELEVRRTYGSWAGVDSWPRVIATTQLPAGREDLAAELMGRLAVTITTFLLEYGI